MIDIMPILREIKYNQLNQLLEPQQLAALQQRKLERLVAYARKKSPFLAEFYKNLPSKGFDITDVPVMTKKIMMDNFDSFCTDRIITKQAVAEFMEDPVNIHKRLRGYAVMQTSGSMGQPAYMVYDKKALKRLWAAHLARGMGHQFGYVKSMLAPILGRLKIAAIVKDDGFYPSFMSVVKKPWSSGMFLNTKTFSVDSSLDELITGLHEFQPQVIVGYPSVIMQLAYEQLSNKLDILTQRTDNVVICLQEPLAPDARRIIRQAFRCPLINMYELAECLCLAKSCEKSRGMHVNNDHAILEIIDFDGESVEIGAFGHKVYITNLDNFIQPIIRYQVSDIVAWEDSGCRCGSSLPLIKDVSGRTVDLLYVERNDGEMQVVHPYWIMVPMIHFNHVKYWQIVQEERNVFEMKWVQKEDEPMADLDKIKQALEESFSEYNVEAQITWKFKQVDSVRRDENTGKIRRIWSKVGPPPSIQARIYQ